MSEREELAEVLWESQPTKGDLTPWVDVHRFTKTGWRRQARAVLASDWLRAHDDRIRAEALAPVLALADDAERRYAVANASMSAQTGDTFDVPAVVGAAALRAAAGTPTRHNQKEDA